MQIQDPAIICGRYLQPEGRDGAERGVRTRARGVIRSLLPLLVFAVLLSGCATPYGLAPAGLRGAYKESNASALTDSKAGNHARIVLYRYNLLEQYEKDPETVLNILDQKVVDGDDRRDLRFALAELSFLYGERLEKNENADKAALAPDRYLTAAVYAYSFLFGQSKEAAPSKYDNRFRQACVFYNRSLAKGLATGKQGRVILKNETRNLPIGSLAISIRADKFTADVSRFDFFLSADEYLVRGFKVRNRQAGLGAPLIAVAAKNELGTKNVPLTVFLRLEEGRTDSTGRFARAELELYSALDDLELDINGSSIPLETDVTTAIAYALDDPEIWSLELRRFFFLKERIEPQLVMVQQYDKGKIPVVFVHGTASELIWWMEMFNTLRGDMLLNSRYQFWFFRYNSDQPVVVSAAAFRQILQKKIQELDPQRQDPALDQMVVIGHSQGGLLTKMAVVDTGDRLWRSLSDTPLEQMKIDAQDRDMLRSYMFIQPLPFVKRVVFIATPHRGSFLAKDWVGSLFRRIASLPLNVIKGARSFVAMERRLKLPIQLKGRLPTSIDSMSPSNPLLLELADTPIVPGVTAHSIIAIKDDVNNKEGNDGVVEYRSAHLPGVASEFIVKSEHSCQQNPLTIEEVRRILVEHQGATGL